MSDATKRCPQCGQRTTNLQLAECPYCRVALVSEAGAGAITPEQLRAVSRHILGSWKLWMMLIVLVAAAAWGVVQVSQKYIEARSKEYFNTLEEKATNRLAVASAQILKQVSNQIEAEFRQPRIQAAIEQVAKDRVNEALTNAIWPSLDSFQQSVGWANSQLAKSTNELAKLDKDIKDKQRKLAQIQIPLPTPASAPAPTKAAIPPAAVPETIPTPAGGTAKLTMASHTVTPNGQDYILTVYFKRTSTNAIGPVNLVAGTYRQTARVMNFALVTAGQSQPMALNDTGDAAQLRFSVAAGDAPTIALEVSAPTVVLITGDALAEDLTLPVAVEKMVLPPTAK